MVSGAEVRLYEDVLDRIFRKHGELRGMETLITDTVASPDLVLAGHGRELVAVKHYVRTPLGLEVNYAALSVRAHFRPLKFPQGVSFVLRFRGLLRPVSIVVVTWKRLNAGITITRRKSVRNTELRRISRSPPQHKKRKLRSKKKT
jgi:hypothetical protein